MIEQSIAPPNSSMSIRRLFSSYPDVISTIYQLELSFQLHLFRYFSSVLFKNNVYQIAHKRSTRVQDAEGNLDYLHHQSQAAVFEGLSYFYAQLLVQDGETLMDPQATNIIFRSHDCHQHIPDGLLLVPDYDKEQTVVSGIAEYTTALTVGKRKQRQSDFYEDGRVLQCFQPDQRKNNDGLSRYIRNRYPHLPPVISSNPRNYRVVYTYLQDAETLPDREHVYHLPITATQLLSPTRVLLVEAMEYGRANQKLVEE